MLSSLSIKNIYLNEMRKKFNFIATWPMNKIIHIGDVGLIKNNEFKPFTSLSKLGINYSTEEGFVTEAEYSSNKETAVYSKTDLKGVPANLPFAKLDVDIAYYLKKEKTVYFHAPKIKIINITDINSLSKEIFERYQDNNNQPIEKRWDINWSVITELQYAEKAIILVSNSKNSYSALKAEAGTKEIDVINLNCKFENRHFVGMGAKIIAENGLTPLFNANTFDSKGYPLRGKIRPSSGGINFSDILSRFIKVEIKPNGQKRNFSLIDTHGQEIGVFSGYQPRDAALKVANRGNTNIVLREKGTKTLHYYIGKRDLVTLPENAPVWIQETAKKNKGKIYKANVEKIGTAQLQHLNLKMNDKSIFRIPINVRSEKKKIISKSVNKDGVKVAQKRNFEVMSDSGKIINVVYGKSSSDAARKVAQKGVANIVLREVGTKKLHYFIGKRELVPVPKNAPAWIQETAKKNRGKIYKANVEKVGTAQLQFVNLEKNNKSVFKVPKYATAKSKSR